MKQWVRHGSLATKTTMSYEIVWESIATATTW